MTYRYIDYALFLIVCMFLSNCKESLELKDAIVLNARKYKIVCSNDFCHGKYSGAEFIGKSDVAHQLSNEMSAVVGDKLKELYVQNNYVIVDFINIKMSTKGMGSGFVEYQLKIPFKKVSKKCDAYTSFDHVGGWNHSPELKSRINQLKGVLLKGEKLHISELKKTNEGLQEYWIQWKNKNFQSDCVDLPYLRQPII